MVHQTQFILRNFKEYISHPNIYNKWESNQSQGYELSQSKGYELVHTKDYQSSNSKGYQKIHWTIPNTILKVMNLDSINNFIPSLQLQGSSKVQKIQVIQSQSDLCKITNLSYLLDIRNSENILYHKLFNYKGV